MERLTERDKTGTAMAACCGSECKYNYCCEIGGFSECGGMDNIIDRLAAIEDILGDEYDLDRLRELARADRDGRCVVLPVKPGTPVWSTAFCKVDDEGTEHPTYPWPFDIGMANEWGTEWFLTQADAEAALRREQE